MAIENNIELLWNSANSLHGDSQTHRLLKSYYVNTCRKLAKNLQKPNEKFTTSQMCPHCGTFWNEGEFSLKLVPKQFKISSKTKKLVERFKNSNDATDKKLTKSQRNRAKWLKKKISNHMAIKCYQCKHKSLLNIEKPKVKAPKHLTDENKSTELEVTKLNLENSTKKAEKRKNKSISNQVQNNTKTITKPAKPEQVKTEEKSGKKSKNKKKTNVATHNKVISKTQKQNSLLQLAALLQKQSKNESNNSNHNRLQSFLK